KRSRDHSFFSHVVSSTLCRLLLLLLVYLAPYTTLFRSPQNFIQSNIVGTFTLLEAVRAYWHELPVKEQVAFRFVHLSTDEVFGEDQKSTRLNSSHVSISYAVFCLKKKKN